MNWPYYNVFGQQLRYFALSLAVNIALNISAACLCFDTSKYVTGIERYITPPGKANILYVTSETS